MLNGGRQKWLVHRTNPEYVEYLSHAAAISPAFAQILLGRGIRTPGEVSSFLSPRLSQLSDPFAMDGLPAAVQRIRDARARGERVLVHGDYDADGVTATAIMREGLTAHGIDAHFYIPNRMTHGYGFGLHGVRQAKDIGATLIITVDCGITSFDAVEGARSSGIDVIITDHHEPRRNQAGQEAARGEARNGFMVPRATALVNPKCSPDDTDDKAWTAASLSGAGVALKVVQGLCENVLDDVYPLLDLAAIGTAGDVVPLVGENRIFVKEALPLLRAGQRKGIRALKEAASIRSDGARPSLLYYSLIPRINAAGRIDDANDVVNLLTTDSDEEAERLALWLRNLNQKRQKIEEIICGEAIDMVTRMDDLPAAIVLASPGWHPGVTGIVASRIAERFNRPSVILAINEDGVARGSGRSIPGLDLYRVIASCSSVLTRYGGHTQAAGLTLMAADVDLFREMLCGKVESMLTDDSFVASLRIDAAVAISDVTMQLIEEVSSLEPFGPGNEEPLLGSRRLEVLYPKVVGNNHLKMRLRQRGFSLDSIGFDFGDLLARVSSGGHIDAAFLCRAREWNGARNIQLNLKAIRPAGMETS